MFDAPRFARGRPPRHAAFWPLDGSTPRALHLLNGCHWPVHPDGDPIEDVSRLFCNAPLARGPYCADHAALAYRPTPKPRFRTMEKNSDA